MSTVSREAVLELVAARYHATLRDQSAIGHGRRGLLLTMATELEALPTVRTAEDERQAVVARLRAVTGGDECGCDSCTMDRYACAIEDIESGAHVRQDQ